MSIEHDAVTPVLSLTTPKLRVADSEARANSRLQLLHSRIALVEDLHSSGIAVKRPKESFSADFQVCLPYRGLFIWHVGHEHVIGDPNQVLFVTGGENFWISQPYITEYAELIITPARELLEEVAERSGTALSLHPLFQRRSRCVGFDLQLSRARFLQRALAGDTSGPALEEHMVALLRAALLCESRPQVPSRATRNLISRTKEFLEAHLASPLRLGEIAQAVGASPAYVTDVFRRVEGIPLHRYLTHLRLGRALVELPHASDLTTLAMDLGFSSHSHFTAAFRQAFGCTPSQFRASAGTNVGNGSRCAMIRSPMTLGCRVS